MNLFPRHPKLLRLLAPLLVATALAPAPSAWGASAAATILDVLFRVGGSASSDRNQVQLRPITEPYSHLGLSLLPAVETPSPSEGVKGLRLNLLVGCHRELRGLDIGVIGNEVTGTVNALQIAGIYNWVGDPADSGLQFTGLQFAGIMNHCDGDSLVPLQVAGILNYCANDFEGIQAAGVCNVVGGTMSVIQLGLVNYADHLKGLQIGAVNLAGKGGGVQIGLWNSAKSLEGLQIGLCNINTDSSMPFFPVVNFSF